jgi:mono/diheme cytochrome c family protein
MSASPSNYGPRLEPAAASDESIQRVHGALLGQKPQPEPGGYSLAPLALLGFMSALILFGCIFLVHNRGGFSPLVQNPHVDPAAIGKGKVELTLPEIIKRGASLYAQECFKCHQPTGLGSPGLYPPLAGSDIVTGNEERLVRIVLHGLKDPFKLNGAEVTFPNKMPNFAPVAGSPNTFNWNDEKISYVLTYIRQEWGNQAAPVTAEKVKEVHAATAERKSEWTFGELPAN